jgi:DNA-binding XRE family transcriptional regulator
MPEHRKWGEAVHPWRHCTSAKHGAGVDRSTMGAATAVGATRGTRYISHTRQAAKRGRSLAIARPYGRIKPMPNIASILKAEISRLARREVRGATESLRKAVSVYRAEISALKRRSHGLEQELRKLRQRGAKAIESPPPADDSSSAKLRFSAKGLASQRRRLGLSASDCGLLLGASGQSVYNWESGKARPQARHLPAIAALRKLGKKEAAAALASRRNA